VPLLAASGTGTALASYNYKQWVASPSIGQEATGMIYAGVVEYAAIIAAMGGINLSSLTSFEPTLNVILIVGGFIFFFWYIVFKY
jgi:hypothetical protein